MHEQTGGEAAIQLERHIGWLEWAEQHPGVVLLGALAMAILAHGYTQRPAAMVNTAQMEQRIEQEVNSRLGEAVTKAVAAAEARQDQRIAQAVATAEQRFDAQYGRALADAQQMTAYYREQNARFMVASNSGLRSSQ